MKRPDVIQALLLSLTLTAALDGKLVPLCFFFSSVKGGGLQDALSQLPGCHYGSDVKFTIYASQGKGPAVES